MILTCEEMRAVEEAAFERGVEAEALMDEAGTALAHAILEALNGRPPGEVIAFCGKGNNGGDALVACRTLQEHGWRPHVRLASPPGELGELPRRKLQELTAEVACPPLGSSEEVHAVARRARHPLVLIDGLLGIGAKGDPREPIASRIRELNAVRAAAAGITFAVDLPSGVNGDTGEVGEPAVEADFTCTIAHCKRGLLADPATAKVGRLVRIPLSALETERGDSSAELLTPATLRPFLPPRHFDSHKGIYGRVGIVAGSVGFLGAARLSSMGAVLSGAGLVTLYVPEDAYPLLATSVIPEVMVKPVRHYDEVLEDRLDAVGLGPGIGFDHEQAVLRLIRDLPVPMVVDADALTMVAKDLGTLRAAGGPRVLTPHPGEMQRLDPRSAHAPRAETARRFSDETGVTLLLKGARTVIASPGLPLLFNSTGNPGMGSGGMGDVLTGSIAGLLAQGLAPARAAAVAAWASGRSAEACVWSARRSPESLRASDVATGLSQAFNSLREGRL